MSDTASTIRSIRARRTVSAVLAASAATTLIAIPAQAGGSPSSADLETLRYQPIVTTMTALPRLRMTQTDCLSDHGLELEVAPANSNSAQNAAAAARGVADLAEAGSTGAVVARAEGLDVAGIATLAQIPILVLSLNTDVVEELAEEGVTPESPLEQRLQALRGLTLAMPAPGSSTDIIIRDLLTSAGLDPNNDVVIQPVSDASTIPAAARSGRADGYMISPPAGLLGVTEGWAVSWIDLSPGDVPGLERMPSVDVLVSSETLEDKPDEIRGFLQCLEAARVEVLEGTEEVRTAVREEYFGELDETLFNESYDRALPGLELGLVPMEEGYGNLMSLVNNDRDEPVETPFDEQYLTAPMTEALGG